MDQSKALHQLLEAADLVGMIEDLTEPNRVQSLSPASWTGMRITLRTIRDSIMESHNTLAKDLVERARVSTQASQTQAPATPQAQRVEQRRAQATPQARTNATTVAAGRSGNLKSTIEQFVD